MFKKGRKGTEQIVDQDNINSEEKETNVLQLITGGKGPPTTGDNWLEKLEAGTVFLVQEKANPMSFSLGLFKLVGKEGINNKVYVLLNKSVPEPIYIDPIRFCNIYRLYETLIVDREGTPNETDASDENRHPDEQG